MTVDQVLSAAKSIGAATAAASLALSGWMVNQNLNPKMALLLAGACGILHYVATACESAPNWFPASYASVKSLLTVVQNFRKAWAIASAPPSAVGQQPKQIADPAEVRK